MDAIQAMQIQFRLPYLNDALARQEMKLHGVSHTTAMSREERDYVHLLQRDERTTKSPRCLNWENLAECGKEVSCSIRKLVDSGRSKFKKKQLHVFALINLQTAAFIRHGARSPAQEDMIASLATAQKSILYYA